MQSTLDARRYHQKVVTKEIVPCSGRVEHLVVLIGEDLLTSLAASHAVLLLCLVVSLLLS